MAKVTCYFQTITEDRFHVLRESVMWVKYDSISDIPEMPKNTKKARCAWDDLHEILQMNGCIDLVKHNSWVDAVYTPCLSPIKMYGTNALIKCKTNFLTKDMLELVKKWLEKDDGRRV